MDKNLKILPNPLMMADQVKRHFQHKDQQTQMILQIHIFEGLMEMFMYRLLKPTFNVRSGINIFTIEITDEDILRWHTAILKNTVGFPVCTKCIFCF